VTLKPKLNQGGYMKNQKENRKAKADVDPELGKGRELNEIVKQITGAELDTSTIIEITRVTENIGNKLIDMYSQKFPKKCNCCDKVFETRNEYLKATFPMRGSTTVVDAAGVQEYRNCVCGSTMLIVTDDRRDETTFGDARRELFNRCVEKLQKITKKSVDEVQTAVRKVFRLIIKKSQAVESLEDYNVDDIA
jgi:hypothetical protein